MFKFFAKTTLNAEGIVVDPVNPAASAAMIKHLTAEPTKIVQQFAQTHQGHTYVQGLSEDIVDDVKSRTISAIQFPDQENEWEEDTFRFVATRNAGKKIRLPQAGGFNPFHHQFKIYFHVESFSSNMIGFRNDHTDENEWKLDVSVSHGTKAGEKSMGGKYYHAECRPLSDELRRTFRGIGEDGREAQDLVLEDFYVWAEEMKKPGSPLYRAVYEIMQKLSRCGPCQFCFRGLRYNGTVCKRCAREFSFVPCPVCSECMGFMNDNGIHQKCETLEEPAAKRAKLL